MANIDPDVLPENFENLPARNVRIVADKHTNPVDFIHYHFTIEAGEILGLKRWLYNARSVTIRNISTIKDSESSGPTCWISEKRTYDEIMDTGYPLQDSEAIIYRGPFNKNELWQLNIVNTTGEGRDPVYLAVIVEIDQRPV